MLGFATDYTKTSIGASLLKGVPLVVTELYVALYTTLPSKAGTDGVELAGFGYSRVRSDPGSARWVEDSLIPGKFWNSVVIQFAPQTGDWGTLKGYCLIDQGNHILFVNPFDIDVKVGPSDLTPIFPPGYLDFTIN